MRTQRAYYEISSADPVEANILEVRPYKDGAALILDKTVFYPEGGGQPADRGSIGGIQVLDVQEQEEEILHIVSAEAAAQFRPGPAELRLDAGRRRDITVHHTAQHLLSGISLRLFDAPTLSMHLGDGICTIDVDRKEFSPGELEQIEEALQDALEADVPVITHLCPPENIQDFPLRKIPPQGEEIIRVVEIAGYDFSPCCGTHLSSAGQIGIFRILFADKYKGMTRIGFIAGRRVLAESRMLRRNAEAISQALKVPVDETAAAVSSLLERSKDAERRLEAFRTESALRQAEALAAEIRACEEDASGKAFLVPSAQGKARVFVRPFPGLAMDDVLLIGRSAQKLTGAVLVLSSPAELKFAAFYSQEEQRRTGIDLRPLLTGLLDANQGSGGGGPAFFQGKFPSPDHLERFLGSLPGSVSADGSKQGEA